MAEKEFARRAFFDFYIHEIENLHNRADWFLVFHGILFEAFLAARYPVHQITLGTLGCLVSWVWLIAGIRQLWDLRHLIDCVKDKDIMGADTAALFNGMLKARAECQPWWMKRARATPAFCIFLPLIVLIAWIIVTTTYAESCTKWLALIIVVASITLLSALWVSISGPVPLAKAITYLKTKNISPEDDKGS